MARRRRTSFPRSGGTRRLVSWSLGPEGVLSPASTSASVFPSGTIANETDLTLVRTRGELLLSLLTSSGAQAGFQWAFGMCIVSENAAGVGATAIPSPVTDDFWDGWFLHVQGALKCVTATVVDGSRFSSARIILDSKAMRKLHFTDVVVGCFETVEVGTATMHAELRSRLLFKLA